VAIPGVNEKDKIMEHYDFASAVQLRAGVIGGKCI
jgi:hypothetical protein